MRPRRHFVEQQPAIGVDKELHGEQADKINRIGESLGRRLCGLCQHRRDRRGRNGSCQNSVFMPVLACREMADAARGITRQKGADLSVKGDHFLENGVIAVQIRECRFQIVARAQPSLSLAVISKAAGLQDSGRGQGFHRHRKVLEVPHLPIARCRNAETGRQRLFRNTVLRGVERRRSRAGEA